VRYGTQGVNPRVVMETLGHSQVSLTLNTYSHVLPALQREAAAKNERPFRGVVTVSVSVSVSNGPGSPFDQERIAELLKDFW
jgi:hypothetical protein